MVNAKKVINKILGDKHSKNKLKCEVCDTLISKRNFWAKKHKNHRYIFVDKHSKNFSVGNRVHVKMGARIFNGRVTKIQNNVLVVQPDKGQGEYEMYVPFQAATLI